MVMCNLEAIQERNLEGGGFDQGMTVGCDAIERREERECVLKIVIVKIAMRLAKATLICSENTVFVGAECFIYTLYIECKHYSRLGCGAES